MIPILYEANETDFTSNGLGRLRDCLRVECVEERNGLYEVEFDYPVTGIHYNDIQLGRIIAVEHDTSGDIQPFDICAVDRPIDGVVTFRAQHISYRLSGLVCLSPIGTDTLYEAFGLFRRSIGDSSALRFKYYTDFNLTEQRRIAAFDSVPKSVREILGGVEGSILDTFGGEYLFNKFSVNLFRQRGIERDFTVRYGVNLSEYNEDIDFSESYSMVQVYYKNGDDAAISYTVDSGYTALGGRKVAAVLDITDKFETLPTEEQMKNAGQAFLSSNRPWLPKQTINVKFVNLGDSAEYDQYKELLKCNLCDTINVVFPKYDMAGKFKIVKTVWDVLQERYTEMELGTLAVTLADALGITSGDASAGLAWRTIETGHITGSTVASGGYLDYTVTFTKKFPATPTVIPTFQSTSTAGNFGRCTLGVYSATATGCVIRVFNGDASGRAPNIDYIAIY